MGQGLGMSNVNIFRSSTKAEIIAVIEESSDREHADAVRLGLPDALEDVEVYARELATTTSVTAEHRARAENLTHALAELRLRAHSEAA